MEIPPTLGTMRVCDDLSLGLSTRPRVSPKSMNNLEKSITAATNGGTYGNSAELIVVGFDGWLIKSTQILREVWISLGSQHWFVSNDTGGLLHS